MTAMKHDNHRRTIHGLLLVVIVCALTLAGCVDARGVPHVAGEAPGKAVTVMSNSELEWKLPPQCALLQKNVYSEAAAYVQANCQGSIVGVKVTLKALSFPLDTPELWRGLLRVQKGKLERKKTQDIQAPKPVFLDGLVGSRIGYRVGGRHHELILARTNKVLYKVELAYYDDNYQYVIDEILAGMTVGGPPAGRISNEQDPGGNSAGVKSLMYRDDPPSLAKAITQLKAQPQNRQARILLYEAYALQDLARKRHALKPIDRQWEAILQEFKKQSLLKVPGCDALRAYGLVQMMAGKLADSEFSLEEAIKASPGEAEQYWALAIWSSFNRSKQQELADKALTINPNLAGARLTLFDSLLHQGELAKAGQQLKAILSQEPDNTSALLELARLGMDKQSEFPHAKKYLAQIVKVDPDDTTARYNLALICFWQKQDDQALAHLECVLQALPQDVGALRLKSKVLTRKRKFRQAADALQEAVAADPQCGECLYNLGVIAAVNLSDNKLAKLSFNRFLIIKPSGDKADQVRRWLRSH